MGGASKSTGQCEHCFNVRLLDDETAHSINWDEVETKDEQHHENILVNVSDEIDKFELANIKLEKLEIWKSNHVYEAGSNENQDCISLRCVKNLIKLNKIYFTIIKISNIKINNWKIERS